MTSNTGSCFERPEQLLTDTERAVAALWVKALQVERLPVATDDFFSLGGDSIAMALIEFRVNEEFGVELPAAALMLAPTLREFAALVDEGCDRLNRGETSCM